MRTRHMVCELCRAAPACSFHHFIPRSVHSNKWFKKRFTREEMRRGIDVCRACHKAIHHFLSEKELARDFNSLEKLLAHQGLARHVSWTLKGRRRAAVGDRRQAEGR